jgi:hypothetical protein
MLDASGGADGVTDYKLRGGELLECGQRRAAKGWQQPIIVSHKGEVGGTNLLQCVVVIRSGADVLWMAVVRYSLVSPDIVGDFSAMRGKS